MRRDMRTTLARRSGSRSFGSGIIFATVPWFKKCHVISGLQFDGPDIVVFFGWPRHEAERGAEPLDGKWLHFDPAKIGFIKLGKPLRINVAGVLLVHPG